MGRPKKKRWNKKCKMCNNTFEVIVGRKGKTYCSKKCSTNDPEIKEKNRKGVKRAFKEKYNGHPMKTNKKTKEKYINSIKEKYGVDWYSKIDGYNDRVRKTLKERYGDENYNNKEQARKTRIKRYGNNFNKENIEKRRNKIYKELLESKEYKILSSKKEFIEKGTEGNIYKFECLDCGLKFHYRLGAGRRPICSCKGNYGSHSKEEREIENFLREECKIENIYTNIRTIIPPLELDIYLSDYNLAIELNGVYWHSEEVGMTEDYHINKTNKCKKEGVNLIHIFDYEWNNKREVVKSIIKRKLGISKNIDIQECETKEISNIIKNKFLEENYLKSFDKTDINYGVFHNKELVSVITYKEIEDSIYKIKEICDKNKYKITNKLKQNLNIFISSYGVKEIISTCDLRFEDNIIFKNNKFKQENIIKPKPIFFKCGKIFYNNKFNKNFNKENIKLEELQEHGYNRTWDCGYNEFRKII